MRRRDFLGVVAGAAAAWPLAATAQQAAIPVIGFLHAGSFDGFANHVVAFRQGLNEAGFIPGQNVAIEYRWAAGHYDRLPTLAAELVSRQVTVLVAGGGLNSVHAAKAATTTIPVVFITGADPVLVGLVTSLNRPEGNITGVSFSGRASQPKRLELIRELLPRATAIAVLSNPRNLLNPGDLADLKAAAVALKQQLHFLTAGTVAEIDQAFVQLGQQRPDALLLTGDPFFNTQRDLLVALSARHRIPAIYNSEDFPRAGGLASYGASSATALRQAGNYAGRILKGAKPADLPVLLPTKFELVINLKTAKALGLTVADSFVLFRVDEVIE